jgi:hypothetical protein
MVMVDEVSMLSTEFLVLLDTRLQLMYDSDQTFGGISILLIGDFIQLFVTTGHDLWSVMYGTVSGNDGNAHNLFQQFCVKELTVNIQSSGCKIHMQRVADFRTLPLGATNARGVGRERRGNVRGGCISKLCVE